MPGYHERLTSITWNRCLLLQQLINEARIHLMPVAGVTVNLILCACSLKAGMHIQKLPYLPEGEPYRQRPVRRGGGGKWRKSGEGDWL